MKLSIYQKTFKTKDGKKFPKLKCRTENAKTYDVSFTKAAEAAFNALGFTFPVDLEVEDKIDYFIDKESYEDRKTGEARTKFTIVIRSWRSAEQGEFEELTISDLDAMKS